MHVIHEAAKRPTISSLVASVSGLIAQTASQNFDVQNSYSLDRTVPTSLRPRPAPGRTAEQLASTGGEPLGPLRRELG
ncbi:hypothetical protein ACIRPT_38770 [Streptomyces sp. NPDC101227]|uniref:hypothetical protein n=1 Tax=Streptomyces sp. NPDC101227 TaxID=3366136 RepID=UPI00382A7C47